ncbi:MAG: DUF2460 domain-containing protein [Bryobacterales bacterium]|nr:DUF2460 domain-containing protein [Bryobacterales bacterium]
MPDFPEIGCHAVAQHPASFEILAPVVIQRYVDGGEQRFPAGFPMQRSWTIRLQRLNEADAARVTGFFESVAGRATSFRFRDPWTGVWFETCWFKSDALALEHTHNGMFAVEIEIFAEDE